MWISVQATLQVLQTQCHQPLVLNTMTRTLQELSRSERQAQSQASEDKGAVTQEEIKMNWEPNNPCSLFVFVWASVQDG